MPGIPLVSREANYSRDTDHIRSQLSEEEQAAAEETLTVYCKPIELYNILQRRAENNPSFLQRSLHYKVQEKHKRRLKLSICISGDIRDELQMQTLLPLYVLLARTVSSLNEETSNNVYRFKRACKLTGVKGSETSSAAQAKFLLPEIAKLSTEIQSGSVAMLLVSCVDIANPKEIDLTKSHMFSPSNDGYCLFGKIPIDFLQLSWEESRNLNLGKKVDLMSSVSMQSCYMKLSCADNEKCISFHFPHNSEAVSILQQVPVIITAEELGAKDKSSYDSYSYNNIPSHLLPRVIRLRPGNVIFNYRYYNDRLQRSEITEDYSCPFCLMKCASYKGLTCHLITSHDLFRYEFWVNGDYQVVIVFPRTEAFTSEILGNIVDPRKHTFVFCNKPMRRRILASGNENENCTIPLVLNSAMPAILGDSRGGSDGVECDTIRLSNDAVCITSGGADSGAHSVPGSNIEPPPLLQFAKTRKLSIERSDPRNQVLLQKRRFFHSHRAQPMALEQVFAEEDSEDEVDDDVADLEDRRMLDDFVDVTQHEKQMMHLWNSFIRKQRVLADAHIPWACEAFSVFHRKHLVETPHLQWCWKLFMVKLYNHGLVDAKLMNKCNMILEQNINQNEH